MGPSDGKSEQGFHQGPHKNLASLDFYIPWVLLIRFPCVPYFEHTLSLFLRLKVFKKIIDFYSYSVQE